MKNVLQSLYTLSIFALFIFMSVSAQAKNGIPDNVEQTLAVKFPNAEHIAWQQYLKDEYLATFIMDEEEVNVFISNKGEFIECHIQLDEEHMPKKILEQLSKIQNGGDVHYILNTITASNFQFYRAKVKVDNKHFEFIFDQYETLVSVKPID